MWGFASRWGVCTKRPMPAVLRVHAGAVSVARGYRNRHFITWSTARGGWTPVQVTVLRVASSSSAQAGYLQCECTYSSDSAVFSSLV